LHDHNYTNDHLEILAELLYAESELGFAQGNKTGCLEYSKKSLLLFEFIDVQQRTYTPDRIKKMKILKERIRDCSCYL
jgi:hypothetical protein